MTESNDWNVRGSGAEIYETVFVPAMMGEWASKAIAAADPGSGERVLDIACGTGALTRFAAKFVGPQGRIVGLDLDSEMLAIAREIAHDPTGSAPIEWRMGDASALPFEDESFDVVFCAFGLMFFPDRVGALKEMRRVLRPNGRLTLMVWGSISKCPGQMAMKKSWTRHFSADAGLFDRQHSLGDPTAVLSLLEAAGLTEIEVHPVMGVVRLPSPGDLARSYGAMVEVRADERTRAAVIDEVNAALQPYVGPQGLVYPIEAILASARK